MMQPLILSACSACDRVLTKAASSRRTLQLRANTARILAVLSGCMLLGCATLDSDYEDPTVTVNSFRPLPSNDNSLRFEIGLRVVNPNRDPLELQGIAYSVALDGRELINGVGKDLPVIEGYSEGTFTVTASASLYQGLRLIADLMNTPKDELDYDVTAKLDIGLFRPAIRIKDSGTISLSPPEN